MDEKSLHKNWVERARMPEEELKLVLTFTKECKLAGYVVTTHTPPVSWDGRLFYYPKYPSHRKIAVFRTGAKPPRHIYLEYNWKSKVKPWVLKTSGMGRSCYKTPETALDIISNLLNSYEACGL